jgi:chorismate mutase/prephenate dehydratase
MASIKVAYFGHPGSFSSIAALKFLKKHNYKSYLLFPCSSVDEVMDYVKIGGCYGIAPYYNSTVGAVSTYQDLGEDYSQFEVDEVEIPVHHCLLVAPGIARKAISKIVSHPQALLQCQRYLHKHFPKAEQIAYSTTSTAAHDLSLGVLPKDCVVIASKQAATIYKLQILAAGVEDSPRNRTQFKILFNRRKQRR